MNKEILKCLSENDIQWSISSSSDTEKVLQAKIDGETSINLKVVLKNFSFEKTGYIAIHNKKLTNGTKYLFPSTITPDDLKVFNKIGYEIFIKYIQHTLVIKNDDYVLSKILLSIPRKDVVRDKKINTILDTPS